MAGINILHFGVVRTRVVGSGTLRTSLIGYDSVLTQTLATATLAATNSREVTRLANFVSQFGQVKLETTAINEVFKVNNITIFVKPIYSEYPNVD